MPLEFAQVVAQLVRAGSSLGEMEGSEDGRVDLLGGPTADVGEVHVAALTFVTLPADPISASKSRQPAASEARLALRTSGICHRLLGTRI
jgi:hypothetical protein